MHLGICHTAGVADFCSHTNNPVITVMLDTDHTYALSSVGENFRANNHVLDLPSSGQLLCINICVSSVDMHDRSVAGPTYTNNRKKGEKINMDKTCIFDATLSDWVLLLTFTCPLGLL